MTLVDVGIVLVAGSVLAILYPIVIYPAVLAVVHAIAKRPTNKELPSQLPEITVVIAAHNEEHMIGACIESIIRSDYPAHALHVIVGDDGSDDGTASVVQSYAEQLASLRIVRFERIGKNSVLSALFSEVRTNLAVFTDADCRIAADAIRLLVANMADDNVGCVIGRTDRSVGAQISNTATQGEASYRGLESAVNAMESALHSTVTSNGHLYMVRSALLRPIPDKRASDDFVVPLMVIQQGKRVIVDNAARVVEERSNSVRQEMTRTVRTVSGGLASIRVARSLLLPSHGLVAWFLWSHRMMRWFMPWFVLLLFVATMLTVGDVQVFGPLFYVEFALVFGAFIGHVAESTGVRLILLQYVYFFFVMNVSLLAGMLRYFSGTQIDRWSPSSKGSA